MKMIPVLFLALCLSLSLFAGEKKGNYEKGQEYYLKYMRPFFKYNGKKFSYQNTQVKWRQMFKPKNLMTKKGFIPIFSKKHPEAKEFLHGKKFKEIMPHIRAFAIHFAKDSGNMPACD